MEQIFKLSAGIVIEETWPRATPGFSKFRMIFCPSQPPRSRENPNKPWSTVAN